MDYISLIGIAVGLSMDAFAVSITNGAVTKQVDAKFVAKLAVSFGLFQAGMPMIGWAIGKAGEGLISSVDHWIALILLAYIGIQMLLEARKKRKEGVVECQREAICFKTVMALAVATSIDALATGIILPTAVGAATLPAMLLSVSLIGLITFLLSACGIAIGKKFGTLFCNKAEVIGGIVLIGIGCKIFLEHMFIL